MTEQQARAFLSRLTIEEKLSLKAMLENLERTRETSARNGQKLTPCALNVR